MHFKFKTLLGQTHIFFLISSQTHILLYVGYFLITMLNVLGFPLIFFWVLVNIFHIFSAIHPSLKCLYLKFQNYSLLYNVLVLKITKLYFF